MLGWISLLACSGPGAAATIARAEWGGWALLALAAAVGLAAAGWTRRASTFAWFVPLLIAHPGWWLDARSGDCGIARMLGSLAGTGLAFALAVALVAYAAFGARRAKRT